MGGRVFLFSFFRMLFYESCRIKMLSQHMRNYQLLHCCVLFNVCTWLSLSCGLLYDRSVTFSKASSSESANQCFLFQFALSSHFFKIIQQLFNISFLTFPSHISFSYHSFSNMFWKAVPVQNVTIAVSLPSLYCVQDVPFLLDSMQYFCINPISW